MAEKTKKSTTIHDLAEILGVSATTVSRALSNRGRMKAQTRQRIVEAARKYDYRPSLVAQTLASQRTNMLGVVVPMIGDTIYSQLVRGVEQVAFERGYNITLCNTDMDIQREKDYLDMLNRRRVEGIVVVPFGKRELGDDAHFLEAESRGIPVVIMEEELPNTSLTQVLMAGREGGKRLVNHLLELGHCRIAFVRQMPEPWKTNSQKRLQGYQDALGEAGIAFDPQLILTVDNTNGGEFGVKELTACLQKPSRPTAIVVEHDFLAAQYMAMILKMGLKIPEDVAIVGFDDVEIASLVVPPLTTMRAPSGAVGHRAAELLFERIEKGDAMPNWPRQESIPYKLVVRQSTISVPAMNIK